MTSTQLIASADGEPVALHDFGGDGPAILFGHGNGLNAGMWAAVVPHLRGRFHCYGIDLRGHGAAGNRDTSYSVDRNRFADDVMACIQAVGAPACYAGHSLGGAAAVFAAIRRPELFRGLWLFEPVVVPTGVFDERPKPTFLIEASRRRRMDFDSLDDAVARLGSKPPFNGCDPVAVRAYLEIGTFPTDGGVRLACSGENEARVFGSGEEVDFARLAAITVPTVVVSGGSADEANALPPQLAPLVAQAIPGARHEHHPGLSHFGPMEDGVAMAASLTAFYLPLI